MNLYNLKRLGPTSFAITKFDADLNVESSYVMEENGLTCGCPAGQRQSCRHRQMFPLIIDRVDTPWFFCFEDGRWYDPTGVASAEEVCEARDDIQEGYDDASAARETVAVEPEPTPSLEIAWSKTLPDDADVAEEFSKLLAPIRRRF